MEMESWETNHALLVGRLSLSLGKETPKNIKILVACVESGVPASVNLAMVTRRTRSWLFSARKSVVIELVPSAVSRIRRFVFCKAQKSDYSQPSLQNSMVERPIRREFQPDLF